MILHRYFARRFLMSFLSVSGAFLTILGLLEFVDQVRRFSGGEVTLVQVVELTLLNIPEAFYEILPLITILATLALFLALARSSELVVTRASGRSAIRSLAAPVVVAFLLGVLFVAGFNPIVAATATRYEVLSDRLAGRMPRTLSISAEGLWLRQGDASGQIVIRASRTNLDGTALTQATFFGLDPEGTPLYRVEAARAHLTPGEWVLTDAKEWRFDAANPERDARVAERLRIPTELTREQIRDSFGTPSAIAVWDLPAFIRALEQAGFSARQHRVWLHMELALPLLLVAMVLCAAAFTLRHTRFGKTGLMVMLALGLGFSLYFVRNFAQVLGENGQLPVLLAAWGPPAAAILLPLGILFNLEDG